MPENAGGLAAPVESSPSLVSVIGEMYGDYSDSVEPESEAGDPPAEASDPAASSEGTPESAPAGDPPVAADPSRVVPDPSTSEALTDADPLDGSSPLAYTVNGESRTFDGITVLKDGGAIIDPDALTKVQQRISERDHLFEKEQGYQKERDQWDRLATHTFRDNSGAEHTLTGRQGLEALRVEAASDRAALETILPMFGNTAQSQQMFMKMVELVPIDANGNQVPRGDPNHVDYVPILNQAAWKDLTDRSSFAVQKRQFETRQKLGQLAAAPPAAEPDVTSFADGTIDAVMSANGVASLSPADRAFAQKQFALYTRPATPQERAVYGHPYVVQPQFVELLKTLGARAAETAKVATQATEAAKSNQAKLAAAAVGRPAVRQAARITPTVAPERTRSDEFDDAWDRRQAAAAGALRMPSAAR